MEIYIAADMAGDIQAVMDTTELYTDMVDFVADGLRHLYVGLNREPDMFANGQKEMTETYEAGGAICVRIMVNGAMVMSMRSRGLPPERMAAVGAYLMLKALDTSHIEEKMARKAIVDALFKKE